MGRGILRNTDAKATRTLEPNYALRAWFTAMYVTLTPTASFDLHTRYSAAEMTIQDSPLGQRLSTQFIDGPVRLHTSCIRVTMLIHLLPSADTSNVRRASI